MACPVVLGYNIQAVMHGREPKMCEVRMSTHSLTVPGVCAVVRQSTRTMALLYDSVLLRTKFSVLEIPQIFLSTRTIAFLYDSVLCAVRLCVYFLCRYLSIYVESVSSLP
jgi:hypothetical protein